MTAVSTKPRVPLIVRSYALNRLAGSTTAERPRQPTKLTMRPTRAPSWNAAVLIASISLVAIPARSIAAPLRNLASNKSATTQATSVLDGVFTADQASRGRRTFQSVCASCHTVAEQTGKRFQTKWSGKTVWDMFDIISSTMPDGSPGSLNLDEYASVIAFLLKETGYPEGKSDLPIGAGLLMKVRIEPLSK
jgi:mono/diheme cytochrome c family protein